MHQTPKPTGGISTDLYRLGSVSPKHQSHQGASQGLSGTHAAAAAPNMAAVNSATRADSATDAGSETKFMDTAPSCVVWYSSQMGPDACMVEPAMINCCLLPRHVYCQGITVKVSKLKWRSTTYISHGSHRCCLFSLPLLTWPLHLYLYDRVDARH